MRTPLLVWLSVVALTCLGTAARADDAPRTVQDLMATYGWLTDRHDLDRMMALFDEDATLEAPRIRTTARGRAEIAEVFSSSWARVPAGDQHRHLITGVRELGRGAEGIRFSATFGVVGTPAEGAPQTYATGYYEGVARKTTDGLRFRRLTIAVDGRSPGEVPSSE